MKTLGACFSVLGLVLSLAAADVNPRDVAVRKDRDTVGNGSRWIYNDYQRGFAEAKRTGKPLPKKGTKVVRSRWKSLREEANYS